MWWAGDTGGIHDQDPDWQGRCAFGPRPRSCPRRSARSCRGAEQRRTAGRADGDARRAGAAAFRAPRAAAACSELRLLYRKPNRQPEERIVHPYHVANVNGDWYLFAFDRLRNAVRTFAPARIAKATPTGKTFPRPTDFNLDQLLRDSFGIHSTHGEFDVVVRFNPDVADYIREKRWHPSQQLRELADGGVEIQLRLGSLIEVKRWILGWGASATVIAPDSLRTDIRATAKALATTYGS